MERRIFKYEMAIASKQTIEMPMGAEVLAIQTQQGNPRLWALVDIKQPIEKRTFFMHGTGHSVNENAGKHIGTFQMLEGGFVFHVFEHKFTQSNS